MKQLDILVVDDNEDNQFAAKQLLDEHNVTIAANMHDAADMLVGGKNKRYEGLTRRMIARNNYDEFKNLEGRIIEKQHFDVVLTDMKLPIAMGPYSPLGNPMEFDEQVFDAGYAIALIASLEDVPYIGILSDANNHQDPMATLFRYFRKRKNGQDAILEPVRMKLNKSILMFSEDAHLIRLDGEFLHGAGSSSGTRDGVKYSEGTYRRLDGSTFTGDHSYDLAKQGSERVGARDGNLIYYKNWKGLLDMLLTEK